MICVVCASRECHDDICPDCQIKIEQDYVGILGGESDDDL